MNERIKKLTGKNPADFEPVAFDMINNADEELFSELVKQDDFLFDFVKENVAQRLEKAVNANNYRNLLAFMKYYSPSYEEFITSNLAKFADEDLTDEILDIFEKGTEDEKTYCAKYFSYIKDPLAIALLRRYAFGDSTMLANNSAVTLGMFKDEDSYKTALKKINSDDDFEQFEGVNFLVSYGDKSAIPELIKTLKKSSMAENIAGQIPYLEDLYVLLTKDLPSGMLVLNNIISGLGEIIPLSSVLDFNLWEIFNFLGWGTQNSITATILAHAQMKFDTLTENDEYLFDEDKNTQNEVREVKKFLDGLNLDLSLIDDELNENSDFVFTALEFSTNAKKIRSLLTADNETLVLKAAETLKTLGVFGEIDRQTALEHVRKDYLKDVLRAL